ncbi:hypothetical protein HDU88_000948 [Geranomyces variabilis]|nr:hypothetical protein HDU88_000948 [Geranomyces variabilis]
MSKSARKREAAPTGTSGSKKRAKTSCISPALAEDLSLPEYWIKTDWRKWKTDGFAMLWTITNPADNERSLSKSLLSDLEKLCKGLIGKTKIERVEKMKTSLQKKSGSHHQALAIFFQDSFSDMVKKGRQQKKLFRKAVGHQGTNIMQTAAELAGVDSSDSDAGLDEEVGEEVNAEADEDLDNASVAALPHSAKIVYGDPEASGSTTVTAESLPSYPRDGSRVMDQLTDIRNGTKDKKARLGEFMFGGRDLLRGLHCLANAEHGQLPTIESNIDVYL